MGGDQLRLQTMPRPPLGRRRRRRWPTVRHVVLVLGVSILAAAFVLPPVSGKLLVAGVAVLQPLRPWRRIRQAVRSVAIGVFFACGAPLLLATYPLGFRLLVFIGVAGAAIAMYEWAVPD
jgi:hypothetical protein